MKGKKVIYEEKVHIVLHDYENGLLEIQQENSFYNDIKLVKVEEVHLLISNQNKDKEDL